MRWLSAIGNVSELTWFEVVILQDWFFNSTCTTPCNKLSNYSWLDFTGFLPSLIPGSPHVLYTAGLVLVGFGQAWG